MGSGGKTLAVVCVGVAVAIGLLVNRGFLFTGLPPKGEGFAAPGWNRVAEVFKRHVESGYHKGGGFAVVHKGRLVLEFVGGYADYEAEMAWERNTLSCLYSSTIGIGAIVIAIFADRGLIDYVSPVAKYWPEFSQNGKESITVEQLLSYQVGLTVLEENFSLFDLKSKPDKISQLLASAKPQWFPGFAHGMRSSILGLCMDQLVQRLDPHHRGLDEFFTEEVSRNFGIDCFIGLPKEENYRCARVQVFTLPTAFDLLSPKFWEMAYAYFSDSNSKVTKTLSSYAEGNRNLYNNPLFREIVSPSSHGFATVTSLAQLYGILANGGRHDNQTLLSPLAVERLNEAVVSRTESVYFPNTTFGRGTLIRRSREGQNIFGHPGFGGQAGFADPKHQLGWAYLTNYPAIFSDADNWKYLELVEAMYEAVKDVEKRGTATCSN